MPQRTSFYELAALLIPILMLSGYVTQRLPRPSPVSGVTTLGEAGRVAVIVLFGFLPVYAELLALASVMSGEPIGESAWVVPLTVALGVWSLAIVWVWPWLRVIWNRGRVAKTVYAGTAVLLVFATAGTLRTGALAQDEFERAEKNLQALLRTDPSILASSDSLFSATMAKLDADDRLLDARRQERDVTRATYLRRKTAIRRERAETLASNVTIARERSRLEIARLIAELELPPE